MTQQSIRHHLMILALFLSLVTIAGCGKTSAPNAPTGLTISSTVSQNVLTWNAVPGAVFYNVYRGTTSGAEAGLIGSYTTTFTDTTIPVSSTTPYYYFVTALDANANESGGSNEVWVTPPVLALGTVSPASVALSWTMPASVTGITGYKIYRSTVSGGEGAPELTSSTTASYSDATVVHGTAYFYRVTAMGPNGETLGSNEVTAAP